MANPPHSLLKMFLSERSRLVNRIKRIVHNDALAEDLAQETFLKLWRRPQGDDTRGLLYRTAQNLAFDYLRAQRVRQRYQQGGQNSEMDDTSPDPETVAETVERWESLVQALETLPSRAQRVFLLNRVDGETYAAIAKTLGVSVSTVEKDMMSAMRICREWQRRQDMS
ncbi:RNA polymerase sigma factor [Halomonas eurihalina]|uniref:RNA polymerase sigma factor n=1 Tax=Halomonas eurihalina TaxID=42566 RepID=A0A5D9CPN5_HALER|nr:RNA polymerase sigma factor [Halomonas eurihalina]MDR5860398.1 RNA polymerase sigma factor [Halomonas eurihalina]TZG33928.1 RNA polymerase sigma factor [Halomonas eurihalina]